MQSISQIHIQKHEIIQRTFFLPDYVMYHIQLFPVNKILKRKYQDFTRLQQNLKKYHPGVKVPFLQKNSWLSQTNLEYIKKQKISLQFFMNQLIKHKQLKTSKILKDFFTIEQHKQMKRKFQKYDQEDMPRSLEQLETQNGEIQIKLINQDNYVIQQQAKFNEELQQFMKEYNNVTFSIMANYEGLIDNYKNMAKLIQKMKKRAGQFNKNMQSINNNIIIINNNNNSNINSNNKGNSYTLIQLPEVLQRFSQICQFQYSTLYLKKSFLYQQLHPFMRYQQSNLSTITPILQHRTSLHQSYLSLCESLSISPSTSQIQIKKKKSLALLSYLSPELRSLKLNKSVLQSGDNIYINKFHLSYVNNILVKEYSNMYENIARGIKEKYQNAVEIIRNEEQKIRDNLWNKIIGAKCFQIEDKLKVK